MVLGLLWSNTSSAAVATHNFGKGKLKLSKRVADAVEFYFSGGKMGAWATKQKYPWKPGIIAIAPDGDGYAMFRHPLSVTDIDHKNYTLKAISNCKKRFKKQKCFIFANAYRIVWDNGSDKKRRRLKIKEIKQGKTLLILQELGFYDPPKIVSDGKSLSSTFEENKKEREKKAKNKEIQKKDTKISKTRIGKRSLAMSWEGYDDLILGSLQFNEKDLVGSLNLKLPNNDGNCKGTYALSTSKGTWSLLCNKNNMSASGTLKWNNKDGSVTGQGKDTKGKKVKFTVQGET